MKRSQKRKIEVYWIPIIAFLVVSLGIYVYHLISGWMPGRAALHISAFNFDIYWYGVIIISGVVLGTHVTSRLAKERAIRVFEEQVPASVRLGPVSDLSLPDEISTAFAKRGYETIGDILLQWGFNQGQLGLNSAGQKVVADVLVSHPHIKAVWLENAPWRIWNPDYAWSGIIWILIFAIIGARIYHILTPSPSMAEIGINSFADYLRNPLQLINLRTGGLGIYGGIAGGAIGLLIYTNRQRIPTIGWADLGVIGVALGQSVGRWGNFFNQELYGGPSNLPWAVHIDPAYRLTAYTDIAYYHPAFLYESLWSLMSFLVLLTLARRYHRRLQTGDLMAMYLVLYAAGRILLEFIRLDSRTVSLAGFELGVPVATVVSIVVAAPMALLLLWRHAYSRDGS
jgi:phosphatidylglycerol---prolipoprotein diacylglyceryl transferase